jgi:hypothetical protein
MLFDPRTIRLLGAQAGLRPARVSTLSEPRMLCESRHYARTQGPVLPGDLEERRRIVARSAREKREYRGFKRLVRPLAAASAWFERGDILEADFTRIEEPLAGDVALRGAPTPARRGTTTGSAR